MKNTKGMDLTQGPIFKQLILFALPVIATSLLQQFYNTADQIVVGKFAGVTAHAAVGSTGYVTNLILNLFVGMSVGATVTCAKFFGAKDKARISKTVHTSIALALFSGLFLAIVGVLLSRPLLQLMDTPADVIDHSVRYMSIIFLGSPFSMLYNFSSGLLRASGDTKRPLYILSVSGAVNVVLNLILVIFFEMAEAGVAIATVASQMVSSVWVLWIMIKRDDDMKFNIKKMRFHKDELANIVKIGIPSGLNAILFNFANITLQSTINTFGKEFISANSAGTSISNYINLTQSAFGTATVSYVGQNYGAKKFKRIEKVVVIGILTVAMLSLILACVVALIPKVLLGMFTTEKAVVEIGIGKLLIMCFGYILESPAVIFSPAMRGMEKSKTPMFLNIFSVLFSRIVWITLIFPLFPANTLFAFNMLFVCFPLSWALSSLAMCIAFRMHIKNFLVDAKG